jgi:hypothetical protein
MMPALSELQLGIVIATKEMIITQFSSLDVRSQHYNVTMLFSSLLSKIVGDKLF